MHCCEIKCGRVDDVQIKVGQAFGGREALGMVIIEFSNEATGVILDWKRYRRDPADTFRLLIDRYAAASGIVSARKIDRVGGRELRKGPPQLLRRLGYTSFISPKRRKIRANCGFCRAEPTGLF
jgi:hypothetical protein